MTIFDEAKDIIHGDREQAYGDPGVNLRRIAALWNAYLSALAEGREACELGPEDVAMMMTLLKMARQIHLPKRDNLIDACGYLGLIERMQID